MSFHDNFLCEFWQIGQFYSAQYVWNSGTGFLCKLSYRFIDEIFTKKFVYLVWVSCRLSVCGVFMQVLHGILQELVRGFQGGLCSRYYSCVRGGGGGVNERYPCKIMCKFSCGVLLQGSTSDCCAGLSCKVSTLDSALG